MNQEFETIKKYLEEQGEGYGKMGNIFAKFNISLYSLTDKKVRLRIPVR
jgi:hypothetical protein